MVEVNYFFFDLNQILSLPLYLLQSFSLADFPQLFSVGFVYFGQLLDHNDLFFPFLAFPRQVNGHCVVKVGDICAQHIVYEDPSPDEVLLEVLSKSVQFVSDGPHGAELVVEFPLQRDPLIVGERPGKGARVGLGVLYQFEHVKYPRINQFEDHFL